MNSEIDFDRFKKAFFPHLFLIKENDELEKDDFLKEDEILNGTKWINFSSTRDKKKEVVV